MSSTSQNFLLHFYNSTVGKKIIMAVTGLIMIGFVVGHMLGNLKIFGGLNPVTGAYKIDEYAVTLQQIGAEFLGREGALWGFRIVLLVSIVLHMMSAIQLSIRNRMARPEGYRVQKFESANAASRTMAYGGLLILIFVVFHIFHFTFGSLLPGFQKGAVYHNVYLGFQNIGVAAFYVAAMAAVALHLYHGTWSMFQTLGVDSPQWNRGIRTAAKLLAVALFLGFSAVPIGIALAKLDPPQHPVSASVTH